ncbi:MAG TPA: hypothetical protein VMD99_13230 [Terriglobales bacterium]|nr:hypothetical protein [Terriglobales bacterium]
MAVTGSAAYAIYPHDAGLHEILRTLRQGGFDKENICMMLSPKHPITTIVRDPNFRALEPDKSAVNAGLIGWLSEFGAVLIPTFGFFIRSREFFRALVVEQDSEARCGRRGTLAGLGLAEDDATRFEKQLREVGVFLYVACPETARTRWALELLRASGAEESGLVENAGLLENENEVECEAAAAAV